MATRVPGNAVPSGMEQAATSSWYAFHHTSPAGSSDPQTAYLVGYRRGYTACLEASVQWAGLLPQLITLSNLLEALLMVEDAARLVGGEAVLKEE